MDAWVTAYLVVWLGVVAYLARLDAAQRRLWRNVEALRAEMEEQAASEPPASRAA